MSAAASPRNRSASATRSGSPASRIELPRSPTPTPVSSPSTFKSSLFGPDSESNTAVSATSTSALTPTPEAKVALGVRANSRAIAADYYDVSNAACSLGRALPLSAAPGRPPRAATQVERFSLVRLSGRTRLWNEGPAFFDADGRSRNISHHGHGPF